MGGRWVGEWGVDGWVRGGRWVGEWVVNGWSIKND